MSQAKNKEQNSDCNLREIDFSDFPHDPRFPQIEGKLFIADNLDEDSTDAADSSADRKYIDNKAEEIQSAPVKLSMNLAFVCVEGQMRIKINLQEYLLTKNTVASIITGSFMQLFEFSRDFKGIVIAVAPFFMNFGEDIKIGMAAFRHTMATPFVKMSDSEINETVTIYKMMKKKLTEPDLIYRTEITKSFLDLFKYNGLESFHKRQQIEGNNEVKSRQQDLLERFLGAVQLFYKKERKVLFYADYLNISPKYLSTVIHEVSGKYATEWIDDYIILDAKTMLKGSRSSIKDICAQLCFANQSIFTKYFKHHTGMTPKEFRNS